MAARRSSDGPSRPRVSPPDLAWQSSKRVSSVAPHADLIGVRLAGLEGTVSGAHTHLTECAIGEACRTRARSDRSDTLGRRDRRSARGRADSPHGTVAQRTRDRRTDRPLDLSSAEVDSVELQGVRIDYLSLAQARVGDVLLRDCVLRTVDLPNRHALTCAVRRMSCRGGRHERTCLARPGPAGPRGHVVHRLDGASRRNAQPAADRPARRQI